jgi:cob(I)alamin adenosyltransferase
MSTEKSKDTPSRKRGQGLIHCYLGRGKGKTTAAIGLAVRSAGRGRQVVLAQFLKSSATGELKSLAKLDVTVLRSTKRMGFVHSMTAEELEECRAEQHAILSSVSNAERLADTDLLILDEVLDVLALKLIDEADLRSLIEGRPSALELVLTGREAPDWLLEQASYVTEMRKLKHPYDEGISARSGIEY